MDLRLNQNVRCQIAMTLAAVMLAVTAVGTSNAAPRALLIGVGEYPELAKTSTTSPSLPGINIDIDNAKRVLKIMGFAPQDIRELVDASATHDRVIRELSTWVRDGVGPEDPVVIYFSGHGTRIPDTNGDEPDGADEVLLMHDTQRVRSKEATTLDRVLTDDKLGELLAQIPSRRTLVLIDACHSGTATRAFDIKDQFLGASSGVPKYFYYDGMPAGDGTVTKAAADDSANYVALAAARDDQYAIATLSGGLFTLGLYEAVSRAAKDKRSPSLAEIRDEIDKFIVRKMDPERRHNPVVTGNAVLVEGGVRLVPLENGNGPVWAEVKNLAGTGRSLGVKTSKAVYRLGEEVEITVDVPRDGHLNIVTVDSQDKATVLFPNQFHAANKVMKGTVRIPDKEMPFLLPAEEPVGPTLVAAFLTSEPIDLRALGLAGRDAGGRLTEVFTDLSAAGGRAIGVAARQGEFHAGQVTVQVDPAAKR